MKYLFVFLFFINLFTSTGCGSVNKSGYDTTNSDTSEYQDQPQEIIKRNDSVQTINPDTVQTIPDSVFHH